jgi:hypothetical protein
LFDCLICFFLSVFCFCLQIRKEILFFESNSNWNQKWNEMIEKRKNTTVLKQTIELFLREKTW